MESIRPLNSIYIHIPFCKSKCHYCNFISFTGKENSIQKYFAALEKEITASLNSFKNKKFDTVYLGGGTPSLIDVNYYEKMLSGINLSDSPEVTIEINPGTVSLEYLKSLGQAGFNRLSVGVQSFNNKILKNLNRLHTAEEAVNTVKSAKKAGFENISIDLIYGLPGQAVSIWEDTISQAISLDVNHISAYGLKIEEGTKFFDNPPENLPDEELASHMYLKTVEIFDKNDFEHYEISNFAKKGYESKHNLAYWRNQEYFGFGLAAHGYVNGVRYSNKTDFDDYINNPLIKKSENRLTTQEMIEEAIFLGLRLRQGIDVLEFKELYSVDLTNKYKGIIDKYTALGLMTFSDNKLKLTIQGILLSNNILADFLN